jgi:hypothetical protein
MEVVLLYYDTFAKMMAAVDTMPSAPMRWKL